MRTPSKIAHYIQRNAIAIAALFVALGGTSYAAIAIPRNSVGTAQIRDHAITPVKLNGAIGGSVRAWATVTASGQITASSPRASVAVGPQPPGAYAITWSKRLPNTCATIANIAIRGSSPTESLPLNGGTTNLAAGYASMVDTSITSGKSVTSLDTFNQSGQPTGLGYNVAVIC